MRRNGFFRPDRRSGPPPARRGASRAAAFTLVELAVGMAVMSILGLSLAILFRTNFIAATRSLLMADLLSNTRKALHGDGARPGLLFHAQQAKGVASTGAGTLALTDPDGAVTSYQIDAEGDLVATSGSNVDVQARGLDALSVEYYKLNADFTLSSTTVASDTRLVTFSFEVPNKSRTLRFYSGAGMRNRE